MAFFTDIFMDIAYYLNCDLIILLVLLINNKFHLYIKLIFCHIIFGYEMKHLKKYNC